MMLWRDCRSFVKRREEEIGRGGSRGGRMRGLEGRRYGDVVSLGRVDEGTLPLLGGCKGLWMHRQSR